MEWNEQGVILGSKRHGESNCILEVMTRNHGRHMGYVHGGRSKSKQPLLQPGNLVSITWRARLSEQLGHYTIEPEKLHAAELMEYPLGTLGIQVLAGLLRLLPERDPHPQLYDALTLILEFLSDPTTAGATIVRFELELLRELGFGLDLTKCASTGIECDLIWVSPKSGRAVSKEAGEPYADLLLPLPAFLRQEWKSGSQISINRSDLEQAFKLSGFFLTRHVIEPNGLTFPDERKRFLEKLLELTD